MLAGGEEAKRRPGLLISSHTAQLGRIATSTPLAPSIQDEARSCKNQPRFMRERS